MTMALVLTKTINNFLVNVDLSNVVGILFEKAQDGELTKNLKKKLVGNFF